MKQKISSIESIKAKHKVLLWNVEYDEEIENIIKCGKVDPAYAITADDKKICKDNLELSRNKLKVFEETFAEYLI